jgi:predicted transglutaminase-like cysteine proteinase
MALLEKTHADVNGSIEPMPDMEQYGRVEVWSVGSHKGDCEDYALTKRNNLINAGISPNALRLTIAVDSEGEGHLFLTVVTNKGDYALDNKKSHLVRIEVLMDEYELNKWTSGWDPQVWVQITDTRIDLRASAATQ